MPPIDSATLINLLQRAGLSIPGDQAEQLTGFYNGALLPMLIQLNNQTLGDTPVANTFDPR